MKQQATDWEQTLAAYKTQASFSGSRTNVSKMFEELAFHYITHVDGELTAWRLDEGTEKSKLRLCPDGAEVGTVSTFKQDLSGRKPYALKADKGAEFLCATE